MDEKKNDKVFRATVYVSGMYEGMTAPDFVPHAAHTAYNVLRDAAHAAERDPGVPQWYREGLRRLCDDAMVLAQRMSPSHHIPEPTGELGARLKDAARLHLQDKGHATAELGG
jgi:hypothetical protein